METQIADLCGHLPTVLEKLDRLRELLAGRRKENFVVEEVAELTGRSEYTIRRWITEGKLKAVRINEGGPRGRLLIPRSELDKLVAAGRGSEIQEAVDRFVSGKWANTSKTLVLCTKESLVSRTRADKVEEQRGRLQKQGVGLITWDSEQLSELLKGHADLVDDFFGRTWVAVFLGREAAERLGTRLDAAEVASFRQQLGTLYRRVFARHDPGLPLGRAEGGETLDFRERYVVPDVLVSREVVSVERQPGENPAEGAEGTDSRSDATQSLGPGSSSPDRRRDKASETRTPADAWLRSGTNLLLVGGPGSGKSSLLRFLATDLLTEDPVLGGAAERWGTHLPVWVSFPLWTQLIIGEQAEVCSLSALLRAWLRSWDEERLWPLVEKALADNRLLLLVDGLDEWTNEDAARVALQRLEVFVAQRQIPSVAASRPHGLARLGSRPAGWVSGNLAGFSRDQQQRLASSWFRFHDGAAAAPGADPGVADRDAGIATEAFLSELGGSPDLANLAQNPLLLSLLIFHRVHHVRLPQTRFRAYESLVEHLLAIHPRRRRAAATVTAPAPEELTEADLKQVLARLAYQVHSSSGPGILSVEDATRCVEGFLRDEEDGFGLDLSPARRLARWVTDVGETNFGLLVRQSPSDVGFLHRTFQEYLASYHLSRLPLEQQKAVVVRNAAAAPWREVVLGLLHCSRRPADVDALVATLRGVRDLAAPADRLAVESLLAEAAFGDFNCSPRLAREVAVETFDAIETGVRMSHREVLLGHALGGLSSARRRELVRERLDHWFPSWFGWRRSAFEAMGGWPREPETLRTLWVALFDEEVSTKVAAAGTLAEVGAGDPDLGTRVRKLALSSEDPLTRAAAVGALASGWPKGEGLRTVIEQANRAGHPSLRFAAARARIVAGERVPEDRNELLRLAARGADLDFTLRHAIPGLVLEGWRGDPAVKAACLGAVRRPYGQRQIDDEVAWEVLLKGFPQDDEVADAIIDALGGERLFAGMLRNGGGWQLVAENFANHPKLLQPIDRWIQTQDKGAVNEVAQAALVGRTEVAKQQLLRMLDANRFVYWPVRSLAVGWGMADPDVAKAIGEILDSTPPKASHFAHIFHRVIPDQAACRAKLLELLRSPECKRPDLVLDSLRKVTDASDSEVVDAVLGLGIDRAGVFWMDRDHLVHTLIEGFHRDPRVRSIAKESLGFEYPPYAAIARACAEDGEIRALLRRRLTPLPDQLREFIAARLAEHSSDPSFTREFLSLYRREEDETVKCEAALSFHRHLAARGEVTDAYLKPLVEDIGCYGPDHEKQRQGAFCGLATLGRLDIMVAAQETIGEPRPCSINLDAGSFRPNAPLLRCVADHWVALRDTFGGDLVRRLSKHSEHSDLIHFYDQLCPYADESPALKREILEFLESRGDRPLPLNTIYFLSRTRPCSQFLLDGCLKVLHIGDDGTDVGGYTGEVVGQILREQFRGDERAADRIVAGCGGQVVSNKTVLAMFECMPEHRYLDAAYEAIKSESPTLDYPTWHYLVCARGTREEALDVFRHLCQATSLTFKQSGWSARPLRLRLAEDKSLQNALMELLEADPTPSERASAPRLLALAGGFDQALRSWCERELSRQIAQILSPEIGLDIVTKDERSVSQCLLDVLTGGGSGGRVAAESSVN
jgi:excisionase family DNA binding protein